MNIIAKDVIAEINRHHEQACRKADEAVSHAVEAGNLLLQVKASLPHGQFTPWIQVNLTVGDRQARRYIAAALGRPTPIRAPATRTHVTDLDVEPVATAAGNAPGSGGVTRSHTESRAVTQEAFVPDTLQKWISKPAFCPAPGHWHTAVAETGAYWIVASLEYPTCFHISRLTPEDEDGESYFDGTRQPVPGFMVETALAGFGLADPLTLDWSSFKRDGLSRPFGEPEVAAALEA